ncbi:MAG: linear amide C-N hydrolase, partial [Eubacteriales bacterium]
MNRKILSFALALTLVLLLSVSCGGASSTVKTSDIPSSAASSETTAATSATVSTSSVPKEQTTSVKTAATSGNGDFAFEIYDFGTSGAKKLFILDYYADYSFGEFLKKGAESTEELIKYLITSFPKAKVDISSLGYGCSAYFTESCDNEFIYGRNFDMSAEMTGAYLVVHTRPENGYESYSTVNLGFIGVKKVSGTAEETAKALSDGTSPLLLSPYIPLDGMNEKGVAISILQLDYPEIHQTSEDNIDITPTTMIRNILDNAADLEEAVAIFKNCNMHTDGYAYHYLVSDASGKSAVIEYVDGKTVTVYKTDEQRSQTVANEFISD